MTSWIQAKGPKTCKELLEAYRQGSKEKGQAEKLVFRGVGNKDVYNIAAPFEHEGQQVIAGRVEERDSEASEIHFFVQEGQEWVPLAGAPVFELQDPFHTRIADQLVLGGVQTFPHPQNANALSWRTVFYKGKSLDTLELFFQGPDQMKDLRLIEQADGSIGVFTRPQGAKGGRGKIGYTKVSSLDALTQAVVEEAPLLDQFTEEEWGGCNEIHLLAGGKLGILGHIACFDEQGDRHYYPMTYALDPENGQYTEMNIIAERCDFQDGPAKRSDLVDVVFSGGLIRRGDGMADLYAGIGDAEAQKLTIPDPFLKYE